MCQRASRILEIHCNLNSLEPKTIALKSPDGSRKTQARKDQSVEPQSPKVLKINNSIEPRDIAPPPQREIYESTKHTQEHLEQLRNIYDNDLLARSHRKP